MNIKEWIDSKWKDPVWSKIIACGIIGVFSIPSYIWLTHILQFLRDTTKVYNGVLLATALIFLLLAINYRKQKKTISDLSEVEIKDENDIINVLKFHLNKDRYGCNSRLIYFKNVDSTLKLERGTAKKYFKNIAKQLGYTFDKEGKDSLLLIHPTRPKNTNPHQGRSIW